MPDGMATGGITQLDEDVLTEILLRLPSKSVLRARAVSKQWRYIATRPCFVAAYSVRRPPEIIVFYELDQDGNPVPDSKTIDGKYRQAVGAINFAAQEEDLVRRPILHYPGGTLHLHAFCDGLLLFCRGGERLFIFIPATRQVTFLPSLPITSPRASVQAVGFYRHRASGEYRVLCQVEQIHYILSAGAGAGEPQRLADSIAFPTFPGVSLHGSLNWLICPEKSSDPDRMVAFDTVLDKFRRMAPPLVPAAGSSCYRAPHLFEMHGMLAASAVRDVPHMDVWVLQDYNRESWAWHLRITIPQVRRMFGPPFTAKALGVIEGNVLVVQYGGLVIFYHMDGERKLHVVDMRTADISGLCQGIYRESLVSLTLAPP
jgi:F-box interacting protein